MKIKLLALLLFVAIATQSFAQSFGIKAGANFSNMVIQDNNLTYSDDFETITGFHVGITANYVLNKLFSFEPELLFTTKGFQYSESVLGESLGSKIELNLYYLDIPLKGKVSFNLGSVDVYGVLGPYVGVGLAGKGKTTVTVLGVTKSSEEDVEWNTNDDEAMKRLDYGLTAGAGVEIASIQIGFTYNYGLANVSAHTKNGYKSNHRVWEIGLGYRF